MVVMLKNILIMAFYSQPPANSWARKSPRGVPRGQVFRKLHQGIDPVRSGLRIHLRHILNLTHGTIAIAIHVHPTRNVTTTQTAS